MLIAGMTIVASSQATWGYSEEGAALRVGGLGKVSAQAAATADVEASFAEYTQRPGLITLTLGVVIGVVALLGWWICVRGAGARRFRTAEWALSGVIAACSVAVIVVAARVIADPAGRLFDAVIIEAVDSSGPLLQAGWGVIATLVVAVIALALAAGVIVGTTRGAGVHQYPSGSESGE